MKTEKPNILFILSDQHNAKVLGHKGHPNIQTPHLDRLASEGTRFDNAISQNPICTPSRVSWLSGQYCHNHGYYGLGGPNPNGLPTILGYMRQHGYATAAIGKIHCPEYWVEDDCDLFLESCGASIGGNPEYKAYLRKRGLESLEDHGALQELGDKGRQTVEGRPSMVAYADSQEGWCVRQATEFMETCVSDQKPFMVHVSLPKPHQCYAPAQEFWDLYPFETLELPPNADYDMKDKAPHLQRMAKMYRQGNWTLFEPRTFEAGRLRKLRGYLGNISHVDHAVGELLDFLDQHDLADNTIVVYSADHGDYACEHGIMEKAPGICSDAITRIPYIWRWPTKIKAGAVIDEIVEAVDFATTICHQVGIEPLETADGQDISHLLQGDKGAVHTVGVTEFAWSKSVRKDNYRLVYYTREQFADDYPMGFGELYDLDCDPWEMHNLYFDLEYAEVVAQLTKELCEWLIRTSRPTTVHPMDLVRSKQTKTRYQHSVGLDGKVNPRHILPLAGKNYT